MITRIAKSIGYARTGIWHAFLTQPNMWVHLGAGLLVSCLAWWLHFSLLEWAILLLLIFMVLILEMINTVAELIVDIASPEFSDLARTAKDVSAGAVLIAALMSIVVGALLFFGKLF